MSMVIPWSLSQCLAQRRLTCDRGRRLNWAHQHGSRRWQYSTWPMAGCVLAMLIVVCCYAVVRRDYVGSPTSPGLQHQILINSADAATLQLLPGVGPQLARSIIDRRQTIGRFRNSQELEEVHRLGPTTRQRIERFIYFAGGSSSLQEESTAP